MGLVKWYIDSTTLHYFRLFRYKVWTFNGITTSVIVCFNFTDTFWVEIFLWSYVFQTNSCSLPYLELFAVKLTTVFTLFEAIHYKASQAWLFALYWLISFWVNPSVGDAVSIMIFIYLFIICIFWIFELCLETMK